MNRVQWIAVYMGLILALSVQGGHTATWVMDGENASIDEPNTDYIDEGLRYHINRQNGGIFLSLSSFARTGANSLRFETLDHPSSSSDRVEMRLHVGFWPSRGNVKYVSYYQYLPSAAFETPSAWTIWTQFQQPNEPSSISGSRPILAMQMGTDRTQSSVVTRTFSGGNYNDLIIGSVPMTYDAWVHWEFEVRFNHAGGAYVKIWKNGSLIINWTGAAGYSGNDQTQVKAGIYRASQNKQHRIFLDDIIVSDDPIGPPAGQPPVLARGFVLRSDLTRARVLLNDPNGGIFVGSATGFTVKVNASPVSITSANCNSVGGGKALCVITHNGVIDASTDTLTVSYSKSTGNVLDGTGQELNGFTDAPMTNWYDKILSPDALIFSTPSTSGREVEKLSDDILTDDGSYQATGTSTLQVEYDLINSATLFGTTVSGDDLGNFYCLTYDVEWKSTPGGSYTLLVNDENCNTRSFLTRAFTNTPARLWRITFTGPAAGVQVLELDALLSAPSVPTAPTLRRAFLLRTDITNVRVLLDDPNGGMSVGSATGFTVTVNGTPASISSATCNSTVAGEALCVITHDGVVNESIDVVTASYDQGTGNVLDGSSGELAAFADAPVTNWYDKIWNTDAIIAYTANSPDREVAHLFDDLLTDAGSYQVIGASTAQVDFDLINADTLIQSTVAGDDLGNFHCLTYDVEHKTNPGDGYTLLANDIDCNNRILTDTAFTPTLDRFWRVTFTGPAEGVQVFELQTANAGGTPGAVTYYVRSATGDDARTCGAIQDLSTPAKTIGKAMSCAVTDGSLAGDIVEVGAGVYTEAIALTASGEISNRFTLKNRAGESPIVSGIDVILPSGGALVDLGGNDYITVEGLRIQNAEGEHCLAFSGVGVTVEAVQISTCGGHGIVVANQAVQANARIRNSSVLSAAQGGIVCEAVSGGYLLLERNTVSNSGGVGGFAGIYGRDCPHAIIKNNAVSSTGGTGTYVDWGGVSPSAPIHHVVIAGNSIFQDTGVASAGIALTYQPDRVIARRNVLADLGIELSEPDPVSNTTVKLYHNTVLAAGEPAVFFNNANGAFTGVILKNNALLGGDTYLLDHGPGNQDGTPPAITLDNNLYRFGALGLRWRDGAGETIYAASGAGFTNWKSGESQEPGGGLLTTQALTALFVEPDILFNFTPIAGSDLIDAGGALTTTVGSGSGVQVVLADSSYFFDGYGLTTGDIIRVGSNPAVQITSLTEGTHTITVSNPITWGAGDPVNLAYSGTAPDLGAIEQQLFLGLSGGIASGGIRR